MTNICLRLFVAFIICFFCNSCVVSLQTVKTPPPVKSFVKVLKTANITECEPKSRCKPGNYFSAGSGIIIGQTSKNTLILTAAHVCQDLSANGVLKITSSIFVIDHEGRSIRSKVILSSNPDTEKRDICLIASEKKIDAEPVNLGEKPQVGDVSYAISAPAGVTHLPAVPIVSGIYSGFGKNINSDLYTLPAIGGSSGSGIFNEDYELIGIVIASVRNFHHITLSVSHEDLSSFLEEGKDVIMRLDPKP